MDTSTSEYLFCIDFFQEDSVYHELIAPTLSVIEAALGAQLQVSGLLYREEVGFGKQWFA